MSQKIIVIGAGVAGLLTSLVLAKKGIFVTLIEKNELNTSGDNRSFAISANSQLVLSKYGLWQQLASQAGEILDIRISNKYGKLHFDQSQTNGQPMGYMVPAKSIIEYLYSQLRTVDNVEIFSKASINQIDLNESNVQVLVDGRIIKANLLIAADGKSSDIRAKLRINTTNIYYDQIAVVFDIKHQRHHNYTAIENFYGAGPIATLPLKDEHCSAVVWTENIKTKHTFQTMSKQDIEYRFRKDFEQYFGNINISSDIKIFDLQAIHVESFYEGRALLIGDAAHSIHPIAGQGLNLSIRDIECISNLVSRQLELGFDVGSQVVLKQYSKSRTKDCNAMTAVTHLCNSLFSNHIGIVSLLNGVGLNGLNAIPSLKRLFVKYAMGYRNHLV